ncbi:MAG: hypothetical protein RBQ78_06050 [Acholeplasmataceae bacterium]|jgi:hypothetical protein|nr:hypothetical protein [Acholeplasmataceae bacterium]
MKFKNVSFDKDKIVFHKKDGSITLIKSNIEDIEYVKPTLFNYLLSGIAPGSSTYPGRLQIRTKEKIGNTKLHLVRIRFIEVATLPDWCLKIIDPANLLRLVK